ncbi:MAG: PIG-L family deacetylase [Gemmatimonadales bacterium]|nr:PIG-L family deacetylase [Gemmatimonadales bacterium]MDZ4390639.1 PIG-L family deacetylase [Gemmatimonadales bacterium]
MIRHYLRLSYRTILEWLYARQRYKLFLREALPATQRRTLEVASLLDHFASTVRPIPVTAPFGRSMLVLAPHQDDEAIGCGGVLALQVASGQSAHIVLVYDSAGDHDEQAEERAALCRLRNEESRRAATVIGLSPAFLSIRSPVTDISAGAFMIEEYIKKHDIDVIFTPWLLDTHHDHRTTNSMLASALQSIDRPIRIMCYEVWGFCLPNVVVRIDDVIETKRTMLEQFAYANQAIDYTNSTIGMNMYRSRLLGAGLASYVEAFTEVPSEDFMALVDRLDGME